MIVLKHATHLEDLALEDKAEYALEITRNLSPKDIGLKIDGSPAVVFGYINGDKIVSTKSFFNKDPKYFNVTKNLWIFPDIDPNVKEILLKIKDINVPNDGYFYQGDLLFTDHNNICTPNSITYHFNTNQEIGICFHTKYTGDLNNMISEDTFVNAFCVPTSYTGNFKFSHNLSLTDNKETSRKLERLKPLLKSFINLKYTKGIDDLNFDTFNGYVKDKGPKYLWDLSEERKIIELRISNYKVLAKLKAELYNTLNDNLMLDYEAFLGDTKIKAEGFMIRNTDVKIVDRETFSKFNFKLHGA